MGVVATEFDNEIGKILGKLRFANGEIMKTQGERMGYDMAYISLLSRGKRPLSYQVYQKLFECYGEAAEQFRDRLNKQLINEEIKKRFDETFPGITYKEIIYILYGGRI